MQIYDFSAKRQNLFQTIFRWLSKKGTFWLEFNIIYESKGLWMPVKCGLQHIIGQQNSVNRRYIAKWLDGFAESWIFLTMLTAYRASFCLTFCACFRVCFGSGVFVLLIHLSFGSLGGSDNRIAYSRNLSIQPKLK